MNMKEIKTELVLQNDISEISRLEPFIDSIGEELGLPPDVIYNLNLALEEAVSNIVLYAYPGQTGKDIRIQAYTEGHCLLLTLTDSGIPFDPTKVKNADVTLSAEERPIGGLGIFLIKSLMTEMRYEYKDGKNILTLVKAIG